MIGALTESLGNRAKEWGIRAPGRWSYLVYNNYHPHITTVNLLWFQNGSSHPQVVTKLFRRADIPEKEYENLKQVHAAVPACTPRPLCFEARQPFFALWMTGVPGTRMNAARCTPAALRSMAETVAGLHRALRAAVRSSSASRHTRIVAEPLRTVARLSASDAVSRGCERVAEAASPAWLDGIPAIPQHGDLCLGNLLDNAGGWNVVDWESFGIVDLPFYDLLTLLVSLFCERRQLPPEWDPNVAREAPALVREYFTALGLREADLPLLLPLALANWLHVQACDGRQEFTTRMYRIVEHYFGHVSLWEEVFSPR